MPRHFLRLSYISSSHDQSQPYDQPPLFSDLETLEPNHPPLSINPNSNPPSLFEKIELYRIVMALKERLASSSETTSSQDEQKRYVTWEEKFVSMDKGRREVRYFLKKKSGELDLALIGKEKSSRHMSYHYAIRNSSFAPFFRLKSRREVVNWLDSIVQGQFHFYLFVLSTFLSVLFVIR